MKAWPAGEIRRIERAYSPKFKKYGFYILGSFIAKIPQNLESLIVFNDDPVLIVRYDGNNRYTLVGNYNYHNLPKEYRDSRGQYPSPHQTEEWGRDGMVTGFPLRPWMPYPVPCSADEYQAIRHEIGEREWRLKKCESPIETKFLEAAIKRGLYPKPQHWISINKDIWYRVDFAFVDSKIAIEVDGHDYHSTKEQRSNDAQKDRNLQMLGWKILRFTGTEIHRDVDACIDDLLRCVRDGVLR